MKNKYPNMFAPITIGKVTFKNRIWTAPAGAHLLYGREEYPNDHVIAYYANKAKGGAATITVSAQNMDIHKPYDAIHANENIFNAETHRFWNQLTDAIHFYGAAASLELLGFSYHGYDKSGNLIEYSVNGDEGTVILDEEAMKRIAKTYADAAENAVKCGFDMILIHGGHGLVLSEILSPLYNKRKDEYGGSLENRAKFPIMILDAIRERVGRKLLIEYRISGSEYIEGGFTEKDCVDFLEMVQDKIDIAHISAGSFFSDTEHIMHPNHFLPTGVNTHLAEYVKKSGRINIPVLTLGGYQMPEDIEKALAQKKADIVSMARGTIADCELVNKSAADKEDEIIPCIRCFHCLDYRRASTFGCSVNPTVGRELRYPRLITPAYAEKKLLIIGGGPAGMKAALTAAQRGHKVILVEKENRLGGKLIYSEKVPFKKDLARFMNYQIHMIEKSNVEVFLNTRATSELIKSFDADAVIMAIGAYAFIPPIYGVNRENVLIAEEAYIRADELAGKKLAIIGGGEVGCETGVYFAMEKGCSVSLAEISSELSTESCGIPRFALLEKVNEYIDAHTDALCTRITEDGLEYKDIAGLTHILKADYVIMAAGMKARADEAEEYRNLAEEFYRIGDCLQAKNVRYAVRSGFEAAVRI